MQAGKLICLTLKALFLQAAKTLLQRSLERSQQAHEQLMKQLASRTSELEASTSSVQRLEVALHLHSDIYA